MTNKERAALAIAALKKEYPDSICSLSYHDPLQLLIAAAEGIAVLAIGLVFFAKKQDTFIWNI